MSERAGLRALVVRVASVGLVGIALTTWAYPLWPADLLVVAVLFLAMVVSLSTPLRYRRRGGTQGVHVNDGILIALLFTTPAGVAPLVMVAASFFGNLLRTRDPQKIAFNAGAHGISAVAATVVFHSIWNGEAVLEPMSLVAVSASLLAFSVLDVGLYGALFRLLEGRRALEMVRDTFPVYVTSWIGNALLGILLAFIATTDRLATLFAFVLVVGMHLGYRGYAMAIEERKRNQHYHSLTRTLTEAVASEDPIERFLVSLRELFGADSVELLTFDDPLPVRRRLDDAGLRTVPQDAASRDALSEALRRGAPVRFQRSSTDPDPATVGTTRSMAAPLIYQGVTIGVLAVHGRRGLETHQDQELQVLASIANDAAIAMQNVQLFRSVEQERSALAEESQKLHDIVDAASDGIAMVDAGGRIIAWNPAMEELTGTGSEEALGHAWFMALRFRDAVGQELAVNEEGVLRAVLDGTRTVDPVDLQVLRRDGEWRWVHCTFSPVRRDGRTVGVVLVARDITRERETEEMKTDFVATVSHELRTPLTPLKGFLVTLLEAGDRIDPDEYVTFHRSMLRQVDRLEMLVSDLLVVADLDRGAVRLSSQITELDAVVESAVSLERPLDQPDRVEIHRAPDVRVVGDRVAIQRIVQALVSNAVKHTCGQVVVEVDQEDRFARVEVHDQGPGIPPAERERVFERFHRLGHHLTRATQGSGLGLSIAKGLAERLGGELTAGDSPHGGAVFTLRVPLVGPRRDDEDAAADAGTPGTSPRPDEDVTRDRRVRSGGSDRATGPHG